MSYTIVGTAFVHRYKMDGEDKWYHEELEMSVSSDSPDNGAELNEDFHWTVAGYDWDDLPQKEGYYAVQYAATMRFYTDYFGEHDCDAHIHWSKITELSPDEVSRLLGEEAKEESFVELVNAFGGPVEKL